MLALKRHQNYHARKVPHNFAKKKKKIEQSLRNRLQVTPVNILFYADKVYSQINNLFGFILQFTIINCII